MVEQSSIFKRFKYLEGINYFGSKRFESVDASIM
jgi:hypothetical protein